MVYSPTWTPNNDGTSLFRIGMATVGAIRKNIHVHDRCLTAVEIAALAGAGHAHDMRLAAGAWTANDPGVVAWDSAPDAAGLVANTGTGGACGLQLPVGFVGWEAPVARVGTVTPGGTTLYPPVRNFYRLPGTAGAYLRTLTSRIPDLLFPATGGALGNITIRLWTRRPVSPLITDGTFLWISKGDAFLQGEIDVNGDVTVTIDDGNGTVETGTTPASNPGLVTGIPWVPIAISIRGTDGEVDVYVGPDPASGYTIVGAFQPEVRHPDIPVDGTFIIGTNGTPDTDPIDIDVGNIGIWGEGIGVGDIPWIITDPNRDPRTPNPNWEDDGEVALDPPIIVWVDPVGDPGAEVQEFPEIPDSGVCAYDPQGEADGLIDLCPTDPLVPRSIDVEPIVLESTFNAWFSGDHRIGVYSTAWWETQDPDEWSLAFADADHEDVFGECPRVVGVTQREDGALILDLDARAVPGIGYVLTGPNDFVGEAYP